MTDSVSFLKHIDQSNMSTIERARAILWWDYRVGNTGGISSSALSRIIESAGHPQQNVTRMTQLLSADRRFISKLPGKKLWRLNINGRSELDTLYEQVVYLPKPIPITNSVVPATLFNNTRGYIEKVVEQINGSYDSSLYDCCAVMCRRLLETLIIEVYEHVNRSDDIKGEDGHFLMFGDLVKILQKDISFNLSRNGNQGLQDFKKLGDLSAHNRRFNARKEDIDRIRDGLRISCEELLNIAKLI